MNSQEVIEQRAVEKLWENCYLRLKRILANRFAEKRLYVETETTSPFVARHLASNEEATKVFGELKADYEVGLQGIKEKWNG